LESVGPVLEAFGYQRIVFGSSPSPFSRGPSNPGDWYELARESLAELVTDQEFVDGIFYANAQKIYTQQSQA
jgi:predicted TIM-barrel fold metal-dependent hydrolase